MMENLQEIKSSENIDWPLAQKLAQQEINICFKVYGWQEITLEYLGKKSIIQFFPFFSSPETTKLICPSIEILMQSGFMGYFESEFEKLDRLPALCLNQSEPEYTLQAKFLAEKGYVALPHKDVMMIYKGKIGGLNPTPQLQTNLNLCENETQKQLFIDIFNKSFFDGDKNLEAAYEIAVKKSFELNSDYKVENYIYPSFESQDQMVACTSLVVDKNSGTKIYNVGVLPEFRKQGLAFDMLEKVIQSWLDLNPNKYLSIETAADSSPERLYAKLGFERVCLQECWVKG